MKIINLTPFEYGAYPPIQEGNFSKCPEGCAIVPDDIDTSEFYECGGFVGLAIEDGVVTSITGIPEAFEEWKKNNTAEPDDENNDLAAALNALLGESEEV